jgi:phosphatidylserine decarboxylase
MSIHREGRVLLFWMMIILVAGNYLIIYYIPEARLLSNIVAISSIILYIVILQFFRSPIISLPDDDSLVYAPAEGKVVVIEEVFEDEYLKVNCKQISIFMSPINVHINRSPIKGWVEYFQYHPGKYLVAWHPKSSLENERTTMVLKSDSGTKILVRQIAGAVARRIKWYVKPGSQLVQGGEFGFIKFGSRVDIFLPLDAEILVKLNQKTKGAITPIARLTT